jgi:hypothetical protein
MSAPFWNSVGTTSEDDVDPNEMDLYAPSVWDQVIIGGVHLPGICELTVSQKRTVDHKRGAKTDGASSTYLGLIPAKIEIKSRMITRNQWDLMQSFLSQQIWPLAGKNTPSAVQISHPALQIYGCSSVLIEEISGPHPGSIQGERVMTFKCTQFVPLKAQNGTSSPTGTKTDIQVRAEYKPPVPISGANYTPANAQPPLPSQDPTQTGP